MGKLYDNFTGELVAVFQDGKVYKDVWHAQQIGSYSNGNIYVKNGLRKKYIGKYNGDITPYYASKMGYVVGNAIYLAYSGYKSKEHVKIAYFDTGDKFGAAAAALITGIFYNDKYKKRE